MAIREISYNGKIFSLNYELKNPKCDRAILFLHGWGSNKELMQTAFVKHCSYKSIYLDLPGFGKSPNESVLTTKDYANIVQTFLQDLNVRPDIVVGHSFGGKVATLLEPKMLVLLSSAGIVEKKPLTVRMKIALFKMLKPFGIARLRNLFVSRDAKGMSEAMYETFKNVVNEDFSSHFEKCHSEALIFWGEEDRATSLQSGKKIAKLIKNSTFFPLNGDHYFFLDKGKEICKIVKERYEKL
ncbi:MULTISPECIES: alpha/beta fold hydrolase [unclassified Nitratiruptor]|uniref:alpha/beta fold hydrolase n=1 Tax=unclassified Nitratiruptor TaxID=2624044 RepID=UPI0019159808|nr:MULTISPECIES: alpha/beta fold hydrolase [unclassified Nitratiruptor]BCD60184.1 2-hydroxy-6-oxohepta-2,4-dienoate hydrolase [Nitratiruptor sp. YY08-10]BCD64327.1 2-hydroxy-6-oxohepta-2,4-dienoate hydrolase [Nitratiruptor sp. YY08-14]